MANIVETVKNELTFENVLMMAMHTPGVKINPAKAGISKDTVNKISKQVINYETTKVTGMSFAASLPGGAAAIGAAAADITSSFHWSYVWCARSIFCVAEVCGYFCKTYSEKIGTKSVN